MSITTVKVASCAVAILAVAFALRSEWSSIFVFFVIGVGASIFGFALTLYAYTFTDIYSSQIKRSNSSPSTDLPFSSEAVKEFLKVRGEHCRRQVPEQDPESAPRCLPVVFGRMVDAVLQHILDLALQDYVAHWLEGLCANTDNLMQILREDLWGGVKNLHFRFANVDQTQLVACEMTAKVTAHFERLRLAQVTAARVGGPVVVHVAPFVASIEKEEQFLRDLSEVAVILLLPEAYSINPALRLLVREILACAILQPAVQMLCDPDFINQKIIAYIQHHETVRAKKRPFAYAESYEDFLRMIKDCEELETLKHIRYNIVTEIMQANVQQLNAKEVQDSKFHKDPNEMQKLKRYINQLTYAKDQCEKRLRAMGWRNFIVDETGSEAGSFEAKQGLPHALPLASVLDCREGLAQLRSFLQQQSTGVASPESVGSPAALLEYWSTTEKMRHAPRHLWHQLAQDLYYTHIHPPSSPLKVDKAIKKRMESFLLGDQGPEVFYEVQDEVVTTLEEKYYASFVASDQYQKMLTALEEMESTGPVENSEESQLSADSGHGSETGSLAPVQDYSRSKLIQLEEKLRTKKQALQALRTSLKPESRVLLQLDQEIERLDGERRQLEAHLTRTEAWGEHLGRWRAMVQSVELPNEREAPQFVLVVHMTEDEEDTDAISTGWVVLRKLGEFFELHRKLCQLDTEVKNLELPTYSAKFLFGKTVDKSSLDRAKVLVQRYLEFVLADDRLNQSEALYTFLSPSIDFMKHAAPVPKKNKFSLSTLFKSGSGGSSGGGSLGGASGTFGGTAEDSDEDDLLLGEDPRIVDGVKGGQDGIAEPLYALLGEVFDLRGLFRWLRRSLITFVQITYGRTISRQVCETVAWVFSEPMLHFYAQVFIGAWWPHGKLAPPSPRRTPQQRAQTRLDAKRLFVGNVPELLCNLVGQQSARKGALKVFEALQETKLNKQLFYELLEVVLYAIFPSELNLQHPQQAGQTG